MKAAARGGIDRRGDFPGQNDLLAHDVRVGREGGREEGLGVWMRRILEQLLRLGPFHDLAQVHDRDFIGHVAGRRQVVSNEQIAHAILLLEIHEQVHESTGGDWGVVAGPNRIPA